MHTNLLGSTFSENWSFLALTAVENCKDSEGGWHIVFLVDQGKVKGFLKSSFKCWSTIFCESLYLNKSFDVLPPRSC